MAGCQTRLLRMLLATLNIRMNSDSVISALSTFRQHLKTFLFPASFPDIITDKCKKLSSLKHLVRTTVAASHN